MPQKAGGLSMLRVNKVFLYPDPLRENPPLELGKVESLINFVGILGAERRTRPYFHTPLDAELATRLLARLKTPDTTFVVALRLLDQDRQDIRDFLREHDYPYTERTEVEVYPSSLIWLELLGKKVRQNRHYITFTTRALDDVQWLVARYGSFDRVRFFVARRDQTEAVTAELQHPSDQISYARLLEVCEYVSLFDYDWEYFYVLTGKPHLTQMVSWFRRVCQDYGTEPETIQESKALLNLRGRLEKLLNMPLLRPQPA